MAAIETNLATAPAATEKSVVKTMVAIFKEEADTPRVLAESDAFIAYTLKNRRAIRLICRANNERGAFRLHETAVHELRFVNFHSNVAASACATDFYVWVAVVETASAGGEDRNAAPMTRLTVKPYFKLTDDVVINRFHFFINPTSNMPDLLVLYGDVAAVLESSKLISEYTTTMLEVKLSERSRELRRLPQETSSGSLCSTFGGGWLAFTSEATKVMACTLRNTTTPAWSGCDGEPIVQLSFVGTHTSADGSVSAAANAASNSSSAMLATCSASKVFLWKLTGVAEPQLLHTFSFGSIVTMLSSRNAIAVFNTEGKLARVLVRDDTNVSSVVYNMGSTVRPTSVCYHEAPRFATVLVDAKMELNLYQLSTNNTNNENNNSSSAAASSSSRNASPNPALNVASTPNSAAVRNGGGSAVSGTPFVDPSIISTGIPFRPAVNSSAAPAAVATSSMTASPSPPANVTSAAAINANPMAAMAAYQSARVALQSAALPQSLDGLVASAVYQSDENVRRAIEGLLNVVKNVTQILHLTPDQLLRDHQQLISLALEAQMTELQQSVATGASAVMPVTPAITTTTAPAAVASGAHSEAFNSYALAKLLAPVASEIATGVTRGVRDTLRVELDAAVNAAFGASVHQAQKEVLRRRLDEALHSSVRVLSEDVARRVDRYVEQELGESLAKVNATVSALEEQNRKLQAALNQIVNSGAVQEVEAMRAELVQLRAAIRSGDAIRAGGAANGASSPAAQSPQTIIETTERYIKEGHVAQGLSYIVLAQNPRCVVQLLSRLSEDDVANVVSDEEASEATWTKLLLQLCEADATESAAELETVASFLFDVLCDHDEIIAKKTAKAQQIRSDIRHLIARARGKVESSEGRRVLKDLEKSIQ